MGYQQMEQQIGAIVTALGELRSKAEDGQSREIHAEYERLKTAAEHLQGQIKANAKEYEALNGKTPGTPAATEDGAERDGDINPVSLPEQVKAQSQLPTEDGKVPEYPNRDGKPPTIQLPEGHPQVELEQDFTTPGAASGTLGCPFAAMMQNQSRKSDDSVAKRGRKGRKPGEPSLTSSRAVDPIAAELHSSTGVASQADAASEIPPQCPIRFLDQHKPEEVAQYFENHKHEIPRSHEVCIKRYQSDERSIRELDAKYGSLVNMIQGLGKKHMPILEEKVGDANGDGEEEAMSGKEIAKISEWAGDVENIQATEPTLEEQLKHQTEDNHEGERQSRFEKSLREVRLGESPSRPWGIQVPLDAETGVDHDLKTPDDEVKVQNSSPKASVTQATQAAPAASTAMVFNGPVFFGYSPEDLAKLFQQIPELRNSLKKQ